MFLIFEQFSIFFFFIYLNIKNYWTKVRKERIWKSQKNRFLRQKTIRKNHKNDCNLRNIVHFSCFLQKSWIKKTSLVLLLLERCMLIQFNSYPLQNQFCSGVYTFDSHNEKKEISSKRRCHEKSEENVDDIYVFNAKIGNKKTKNAYYRLPLWRCYT